MSPVPLRVILREGRSKSARNHHPWVFSGSVANIEGEGPPGSLADLHDANGEFLARGFANRNSQIVFRALLQRKSEVDAGFFSERIAAALRLRADLIPPDTSAYRLVHGEGDLLPGLVVDRYGDFLVCQFGAAGMDLLRGPILEALDGLVAPRGIWERSEGPSRREEGLEERNGHLRGEEPPERVEIREGGLAYVVDLRHGHKTGFYLDQRPGRAWVRALARGRRVLDVFSYTGGFATSAVAAGAAAAVAIDSSAPSLALLPLHLERNGLPADAVRVVQGDAFKVLREMKEPFDLIVVDPPPFAKRKHEVEGAARGYKDVNLQALRLLAPGGILLTSSCSHHVDPWLFQQILFGAARDAGKAVQLLARGGQPPDHPVSLHHPEGEYLKLFVLRAL